MPHDQIRKDSKVDKRRRPCSRPVCSLGPIRDNVEAELAIGRLSGAINLVHRSVKSPVRHDDLKMLNETLNAPIRREQIRQHHLAVGINVDGLARKVLDRLLYDIETL